MKRCALIFCLGTLVLPGLAQQANNANANPGAPQGVSGSQDQREPLEPPKSGGFWDGDDPNIVNLVTHPFARKQYVLRHTLPIRDRLNELEQSTAENSRTIRDVDTRSQQGIQLASEKISLADQHASDAATKAQAAQAAANEAATRVSSVEQRVGNLEQYKRSGQTEIRFRPGQSVLSKASKNALDQIAEPLKSERNYIIEVRGFSSGHGQTAIAHAHKMSNAVVHYLVLTHQIPVYRISVLNLGNAATGEGAHGAHGSGGRVEVSVLRNQ